MFLVVTGNFNPYEAMALVNEVTKDMSFPTDKVTKKKIKEDDKVVVAEKTIKDKMVENPKLTIAYKMKRSLFKDFKDEELKMYLSAILAHNFGSISDFRETLLEQELIINLGYKIDINEDLVVISLRSVTKYPKEVAKLIKEKMSNLEINENILKTLVKASWADVIWGFDDIFYVNDTIQNEVLTYGEVLSKLYSIFKKCNITDANRILKNIDLKNNTVLFLEKEN